MLQRKILLSVASAVASVGLSALISGCESPPRPPRSTPVMYGTNGNRGVTAPSQGVPQNVGQPLGGTVTSTPGTGRPDQTIVGPSAAVDPSGNGTIGTNSGISGARGG